MRHMRTTLAAVAIVVAAGASGLGQPPIVTTLSVAGRTNATPWIAARGRDVAVVWGASTSAGATDVFLATSRDGGASFGAPVRVNVTPGDARLGGELPPRVAIGPARSGSDPEVVVLWTARDAATSIRIARSSDAGRTFGAPVVLQQGGAAGDRGWPALALADTGTAHVVWLDHRGLASGADKAQHDHRRAEYDGVAMAQKSALYYASTSSSEAAPERALAHGVCYCCKTALATGSGGAVFAAWRHVYAGNRRDIAFAASHDGGRSFDAPVRVSEDEWAIEGCPDDGPAMAVDAGGTVHVVWPTVTGGAEPRGALFYAATRDGRSFTPRQEIPTLGSLKPSHPQIAIGAGGRLVVGWDESIDGRRVAAVRPIETREGRVTPGPLVRLGGDSAAIYPVIASVGDAFIAAWTAGAGDGSTIGVRRLRF